MEKNNKIVIIGIIALIIISGAFSDFYPAQVKDATNVNSTLDGIAYTLSKFFGTENLAVGYTILAFIVLFIIYKVTGEK